MRPFMRTLFLLLLCLTLLLCATGCGKDENADPTIPRFRFLREKAETLTLVVTEEDFPLLEECTALTYLDITGSTCYDAMLRYEQAHPEVEVVYTVPLGNQTLSNSETGALLTAEEYTADSLKQQLNYLPSLTVLDLPKTGLTATELESLQSAFPDLQIRYTVDLLGQEYAPDATAADLSALNPEDLEDLPSRLELLPNLTEIELMQGDHSNLSLTDVRRLMDLMPEAHFHYTFDFFGQTLSTDTESAEFEDISIGNAGESQIRAALDIMPRCTYLKLEDCGISNEVLASIRDDYPGTKIAWRVYFGGYTTMTDDDTLRAVYNVFNEHVEILKYCTGVKYIDMGHNTTLTDLSFIGYMPDLEILIASGSSITNLNGIENCKKLEWLELAYCYELRDITPLAQCDSLRFLNISFSQVTDLTPIENLPLERFLYLGPKVDQAVQNAYAENHPDCWSRFTGQNPYSLGWRYDDIGETRSEYYKKVREVFNLDAVDAELARQAAEKEEAEYQAAKAAKKTKKKK